MFKFISVNTRLDVKMGVQISVKCSDMNLDVQMDVWTLTLVSRQVTGCIWICSKSKNAYPYTQMDVWMVFLWLSRHGISVTIYLNIFTILCWLYRDISCHKGVSASLIIEIFVVTNHRATERVNYHHLGLINVRSIKSKDQALLNYALEHKFDAIIITETWLKDNNDIWKSASCLNRNGYHLLCSERPEMKQGSGIGLMFRSDLKVKTLEEGCRIHLIER